MTEAPIQICDLRVGYGAQSVLDGVSFEVPVGETLALLGVNGAGKSTTIRTLMGLQQADSGSVTVAGLDPCRSPLEVRRRTGYLAEDQQMFGWMTVGQLINFVGAFYPTWDDELAAHYLARFQLVAGRKVGKLSKGQGVRLGLLLALAHRPQVVVLDDPALALDPIMRREFNRDLVTHLQDGHCTVLYSSHLLAEVEAVADRIAILHEGRIIRCSTTEDLRDDVKQLVFPTHHLDRVEARLRILDIQMADQEVALTVEQGELASSILGEWEIPFRSMDLSLDEIFAAYVTGVRAQTVSGGD